MGRNTVDDIEILHYLRTPNYGNSGIFLKELFLGNAGFISSTVTHNKYSLLIAIWNPKRTNIGNYSGFYSPGFLKGLLNGINEDFMTARSSFEGPYPGM